MAQMKMMHCSIILAVGVIACTGAGFPQQSRSAARSDVSPTLASTMDAQLSLMEKQVVGAAEAMPAEKYSFVPDGQEFKGSRTFALQVRHLAAGNFAAFSEILGQAPPLGVSFAPPTNGPEDLHTKEQIVQFLKDSYALGHKAIATISETNALVVIKDPNLPFSQPNFRTRLALASFAVWHASDHYGQMVVYLRMNGIVPPASNGQPPANPQPR
jgi:hypothetical protein